MIVGASGHGCVVADAVGHLDVFELVGFLDDSESASIARAFGPLLGKVGDAEVLMRLHQTHQVVVAIGDNYTRRAVVTRLTALCPHVIFPPIVHSRAIVSRSSTVGEGSVICAGAVLGAGSVVGRFAIVNTAAALDHHSTLSDYASLGPSSAVGGDAIIGEGTAVGMGAMTHHGIRIGAWSVLGSGSVANNDVPDGVVAFGAPVRIIRSRAANERYL